MPSAFLRFLGVCGAVMDIDFDVRRIQLYPDSQGTLLCEDPAGVDGTDGKAPDRVIG